MQSDFHHGLLGHESRGVGCSHVEMIPNIGAGSGLKRLVSQSPSGLVGYLGAVLAVLFAVVSTYAIYAWIEPSISILFFPAVVIPAIYGGYGPALVATILSTVALAYLFVPPRYSFNIGIDDAVRLGVFVLVAFATAWLSSARRRAEEAQRKSVDELRAAIATLRKVSGWPVLIGPDLAAGVRKMLAHAASVVAADDVVVTWESEDEPWLYLAATENSTDPITRHSPTDLTPLVAEPLESATFLCSEVRDNGKVLVSQRGVVSEWRGQPLHPDLVARLPARPLASAPFRTEHLAGRVFFSGIENAIPEIIPAVDVAAREVGNSLDQMFLAERARELAVREDRIRVSRDLHDGVLQALTGIRLELQAIADDCEAQPATHDRLLAIERALSIEQRELRLFIDELKPKAGAPIESGPITERLREMCSRLAVEWRAPIAVQVNPPGLSLTEACEQNLRLMVHEAVVNALKHAHPSRVAVSIDSDETELRIVVSDDGRGFPFRGRVEHEALVKGNAGPASLRDRVTALEGRMAVESSSAGSRVEFAIPMATRHA